MAKQKRPAFSSAAAAAAAAIVLLLQPCFAESQADAAAGTQPDAGGRRRVLFVLMCQSQLAEYHRRRCSELRSHIELQAAELRAAGAGEIPELSVSLAEDLVPDQVESFYFLPILIRNDSALAKADFVFFCHEETRMRLGQLLNLLSGYNASEPLFLGSPLQDEGRYIVHHFSQSQHPYPFIFCGFAMSRRLVSSLTAHFHAHPAKMHEFEFRIDPAYELASLISVELQVANLTALPALCRRSAAEGPDGCVTWATEAARLPQCARSSSSVEALLSRTVFAVKTHRANFGTVLQVVKDTWAQQVPNIRYYADVEDPDIPAIACGVPNTERGHCDKLNRILHLLAAELGTEAADSADSGERPPFDWFVICDDDTLLSPRRLAQLLACHGPQSAQSQPLVLGEKYGYSSADGLQGFAYPTGGSGLALNAAAMRRLTADSSAAVTRCGSAESPDDMSLGVWLRALSLPLLHSHQLHQARTVEYPPHLLAAQLPVSFHKHLDCDPRQVYRQYLLDEADATSAAAAASAAAGEEAAARQEL